MLGPSLDDTSHSDQGRRGQMDCQGSKRRSYLHCDQTNEKVDHSVGKSVALNLDNPFVLFNPGLNGFYHPGKAQAYKNVEGVWTDNI